MKAIVYHNYGSPDDLHLTEVDKPLPKANEVLVKIHAASINSWDWDMIIGKPFLVKVITGLFKPRKKIIGSDIAGIVEAVGNNVTSIKVGDEVFGDISGNGFGGFAEYVSVPEDALAIKSQQLDFTQAASLPQAGLMAIQGLRDSGQIKAGTQLLINGAAGGVGTIGLQYAKSVGAEVTCVDSSDKFDILLALGADHLIDYTKEDYTRNGQQYDVILDVIAHRKVTDYKRALKPNGNFIMIGGSMGGLLFQMVVAQPLLNKYRSKKLGMMGFRPNRTDLNFLSKLCEEGAVEPVIDSTYPLSKTVDAFKHFKAGNFKGKIMINVSDD